MAEGTIAGAAEMARSPGTLRRREREGSKTVPGPEMVRIDGGTLPRGNTAPPAGAKATPEFEDIFSGGKEVNGNAER